MLLALTAEFARSCSLSSSSQVTIQYPSSISLLTTNDAQGTSSARSAAHLQEKYETTHDAESKNVERARDHHTLKSQDYESTLKAFERSVEAWNWDRVLSLCMPCFFLSMSSVLTGSDPSIVDL